MLIIALIITVLVVTFFAKPLNENCYRMAIGGIYGILFLIVWPYFNYFTYITELDEQTIKIAFVVFSIVAAGLLFLPGISRIGQFGSAAFFTLFIITIVISFSYESLIKFNIGKLTGYFNDVNPVHDIQSGETSYKFTNTTGGYAVKLPLTWQQQNLESTSFPYYVLLDDGVIKAEFRPKCFHGLRVALPEMVQGMMEHSRFDDVSKMKKNCFTWHDNYNACLLRNTGDLAQQVESRWQWFGVNYDKQQGIELDFVLYDNSASVINDIEMIITSLEPIPLSSPPPICMSVAEWM